MMLNLPISIKRGAGKVGDTKSGTPMWAPATRNVPLFFATPGAYFGSDTEAYKTEEQRATTLSTLALSYRIEIFVVFHAVRVREPQNLQ